MAVANSSVFFASSSSAFRHRSRVFALDFAPILSVFGVPNKCSELGFTFSTKKNILYASADGLNAVSSTLKSEQDADYVPMPKVHIDQDSDSDATIVQLSFGDRLGALLDTMKALKDLGLDVSKGTVTTEGSVKQTKFFIKRL